MKACLVLVAVVCGIVAAAAQGSGGWRAGRGTFYGNEPWLWDIHKGSCGYGQLDPNKGTGWDIAAMPDVHYEYSNSCGRCYEVRCRKTDFSDNYGNKLDRWNSCFDDNASFVVMISDTCPCEFPDNYYSNKRWCCGDMDHLDLSVYTFEKMAERRWGVIGIEYRPAPCPSSQLPQVVSDGQGSRLYWLRERLLYSGGSGGNTVQAFDSSG